MKRVTLRVPDQLLEDLDALAEEGEYLNRSDAIRTAIRDLVDDERHAGEEERRWGHYADGGQR